LNRKKWRSPDANRGPRPGPLMQCRTDKRACLVLYSCLSYSSSIVNAWYHERERCQLAPLSPRVCHRPSHDPSSGRTTCDRRHACLESCCLELLSNKAIGDGKSRQNPRTLIATSPDLPHYRYN
jgi:hypothetical protein